jgi:hypothetical protein
MNGPCPAFSPWSPLIQQFKAFQARGAIGVLVGVLGSNLEIQATTIFNGGPVPKLFPPCLAVKFVKNWYTNFDDPSTLVPPWTNTVPLPGLPPATPAFPPFALPAILPNTTLPAILDQPDITASIIAIKEAPNAYGFVYYTSVVLALISLSFCVGKLMIFVIHQEGPKLSFPQIELLLVTLATFWLLFNLLWGPDLNAFVLSYGVNVFFHLHFTPYWYSAIVVFSFYLVEVSTITSQRIGGLDTMKIPALIVCIGLFVIEIVGASIFSQYPPGVDYIQIITMISCMYLVSAVLITALVAVSAVMLVLQLLSSGKQGMAIRFGLTGFSFIVLLWGSCLVFIFLIRSTLSPAQGEQPGSPVWGEFYPCVVGFGGIWFATAIASIIIAASFSVSVEKEIEMSKSGTSSTSGFGSSSSSSSSSSSKSADPVIGL